jgi:phosphoglycolate phosphatase-like HAD superfamily hydrolase
MRYFFKAVGFQNSYVDEALTYYKKFLMRDYAPKPFRGVVQMLLELGTQATVLGITTSNIMANIETGLGENMEYFNSDLIFTKDHPDFKSKSNALKMAMTKLGIHAEDMLYVGDQPFDFEAAESVGVRFLGVAYGWGITEEDDKFPVVDTVKGIARYILDDHK